MNATFEPLIPRDLLERFPATAESLDIEGIKCPVCSEVCLDAVIESACNHTFCKRCIEKSFQESKGANINCPQNPKATISKNQIGPNRAVRDIILKIKVRCVLKDQGCKWTGSYSSLDNHLTNECPEIQLKCQNFGCEVATKRSAFSKHQIQCGFRPKQCKYCNSYFIANKLAEHEGYCTHQMILCPYACGKKLKKKDCMQHHSEECLNAVLPCEYAEHGCDLKVKRHRYQTHLTEYNDRHLEMVKTKTLFYKQQWTTLESEVSSLRDASQVQEINMKLAEKVQEVETPKQKPNIEEIKSIDQSIQSVVQQQDNTASVHTLDRFNQDDTFGIEQSFENVNVDGDLSVEEEKRTYTRTQDPQKSTLAMGMSGQLKSQPTKTEEALFDVQKEGWLMKKSKYLGEWRKRWMVLTTYILYAYKEERNYSSPTEKIPLRTIEQVSEGPQEADFYTVLIKLRDGKFIQLRAKKAEDARQWIQWIGKSL